MVDEYAHSNLPGSRNPKRWQDVDELLNAGINVLSTVNIQHLASLGDVVSAITDVSQAETCRGDVPIRCRAVSADRAGRRRRRADQIDLVDIPPELLRQRLSDGNIYAADKSMPPCPTISGWATSVLFASSPCCGWPTGWMKGSRSTGPSTGSRAAGPPRAHRRRPDRRPRGRGAHPARGTHPDPRQRRGPPGRPCARSRGSLPESPQALERQRRLIQDLGGSYHIVAGEDPATALLDFARSVNATQIVVGISRRKNLSGLLGGFLGGGVGTRVVRGSGDIDVHMVSHALGGQGTGVPRPRDLGRVRVPVGFLLAVLLPALLQLLLMLVNPHHSVATAMLIQLTGSVAVALVGGLWPAVLAALWSSLLVNYFSTPPHRPPDHQRPAELPGALRLPGSIGRRGRGGGPVRPPLEGGRTGAGRGHHAQ